jgi:hypothetical protein
MDALQKFHELKHHIVSALAYNNREQTIEDVEACVVSGEYKVWTEGQSIALTEDCALPRRKYTGIVLAGGVLAPLQELAKKIEEDAKARSLDGVLIVGRAGWGRVLNGFRNVATVHLKEF